MAPGGTTREGGEGYVEGYRCEVGARSLAAGRAPTAPCVSVSVAGGAPSAPGGAACCQDPLAELPRLCDEGDSDGEEEGVDDERVLECLPGPHMRAPTLRQGT
jgi:hypothetical protein